MGCTPHTHLIISETRQEAMEPNKFEIAHDTIVAVDISETMKTIAAMRILWTACKPHTYSTLSATCQETMEPNKNKIGCVKIVAVDSRQAMRIITAIRILRTGR